MVSAGDEKALAKSIENILALDDTVYTMLGNTWYQLVKTSYTWDKIIWYIYTEYKQLFSV
jgi:hypothetical protein